jgi:hypothetical protein
VFSIWILVIGWNGITIKLNLKEELTGAGFSEVQKLSKKKQFKDSRYQDGVLFGEPWLSQSGNIYLWSTKF